MSSRQLKRKSLLKKLNIKTSLFHGAVTVDFQGAIELVRRARETGNIIHSEYIAQQISQALPRELDAQLPLLDGYTRIQRGESADAFVEKLLKKFPGNNRVLKGAARYFLGLGLGERSIELLLRAININSKDHESHFILGMAYSAQGEKEQAIAEYDRAIELAPDRGVVYYLRAQLTKSDTPAEDVAEIEALLTAKTLSSIDQGKLHLAAAWCYDQKDIERQFYHLQHGNDLLAEAFAWSADYSRRQYEAITGFVNRDLVNSLRGEGNDEPTPIYIAAMPRSGTTLLEQILGAHSQTMPIGESQMFNFAISQVGFDLGRSTAYWEWGQGKDFARILTQLDDYYQHHAGVRLAGQRRIIEKSLDNYMTAGLILLTHPNARIIHLRRHPLDTLISVYQLYIESGPNIPFRLEDLAVHYQRTIEYMEHWKALFPDRILTVDYEQMVSDQENSVRKILSFCQLPWEENCLEFHKQEAFVNTPSAMQVRKELHKGAISRWKPFAEYLRPAANILGIDIDQAC